MDYWRVVEIGGTARILAGANSWNQEAQLEMGDVVGPYQAIRTGVDSHVILMRDDDIVVVYSGATTRLPGPNENRTETYLVQEDGDAFYVVDPRSEPSFTVETPVLIAGVKGTQFGLSDNAAWLAVIEGIVDAENRATGEHADTPAGQGVSPGGVTFAAAPLTEAQLSAARQQMEWVETRRLHWQRQRDALLDMEIESSITALADATLGSTGPTEEGAATGPAGGALGGVLGATTNTLDQALGQSLSTVGGTLGDVGSALSGTTGSISGGLSGTVGALGGTVGGLGEALSGGSSSGGSGSSGGGSGGSSGGSGSSGSSGSGSSGSGSSGSGGSGSGGGLGGAVGGVGEAVGGAVGGLL